MSRCFHTLYGQNKIRVAQVGNAILRIHGLYYVLYGQMRVPEILAVFVPEPTTKILSSRVGDTHILDLPILKRSTRSFRKKWLALRMPGNNTKPTDLRLRTPGTLIVRTLPNVAYPACTSLGRMPCFLAFFAFSRMSKLRGIRGGQNSDSPRRHHSLKGVTHRPFLCAAAVCPSLTFRSLPSHGGQGQRVWVHVDTGQAGENPERI